MRAWISLFLGIALLLTIPACESKPDPTKRKDFNAAAETDPSKIAKPSTNTPPPGAPPAAAKDPAPGAKRP